MRKLTAVLVLLITASAMAGKPYKPPRGGGNGGGGSVGPEGATLWLNAGENDAGQLTQDVTKDWWIVHPGTAGVSQLVDQRFAIAARVQTFWNGMNVDDGLPHPPLNIHTITQYTGTIGMPKVGEVILESGKGEWLAPYIPVGSAAGIALPGDPKAFVFDGYFLNDPDDAADALGHEAMHEWGVPGMDGNYPPGYLGGLPYGYGKPLLTLTQYNFLAALVGTVGFIDPLPIPEPSLIWLLIPAVVVYKLRRYPRCL